MQVTTCSNYSAGCVENVTLHKPSGDETLYQLTLNNGAWNTQVTTYTGPAASGQVLVQTTNSNTYTNGCYNNPQCVGANYLSQKLTTTEVFPNGSQSQPIYTQTDSFYNQFPGKPSMVREWGFTGSANTTTPPNSTPTRETDFSYSGYDLQTVKVLDSSGNQVAQTSYGYTTSATATSGLPKHGAANAGGPYLHTLSRWLKTGNPSVTTYTMDDAGQTLGVTDPDQHPATTMTYQCADSLPFQVTNALSQTTTYGYDCSSGAITSIKDPNDSAAGRSGTVYQYEATAGRPQSVTYPDGGQTTYSYPSATEVDTSVLATPDPTITSESIVDSFGRPHQKVVAGVSSETTYDVNGRAYCVTNPHTSSTSSTDGTTCTVYDGLDRPTTETEADGNTLTWSYNENTATSTDEAGHSWQRTSDVFGELTSVVEPGNLQTSYTYDALGNLLAIAQNGTSGDTPRTRSFTYDSLSRMMSSTTPEAGTITYSYDANGNLHQKTDARGVWTQYAYDALNRLTDKYFNDGPNQTPNQHFRYDQASGWMGTQLNTIGRLSEVSTDHDTRYYGGGSAPACNPQSSATANYNPAYGNPTYCTWTDELFAYDAMGRQARIGSASPSEAGWAAHGIEMTYDLAGNMTSLKYPDGRVVDQTFNSLGQMLTSIFDNWNGQHVGYTYAAGLTYTPTGAQAEVNYGNGVYIHTPYDNRGQMCQVWSSDSAQTLIDTHIYYGSEIFCSNTPGNNGNISEVKDWRNPSQTRYFTYDSLNRIASYSTGATSPGTPQQGYTFDSFGNLKQSGTLNSLPNYGTNNQITSDGYDAAGNLTQANDGISNPSYIYDAESKMFKTSAGGYYTYDGAGERMRKDFNGDYTEYQYLNGQVVAEKHPDGSWSDYIYANGQKIARADSYDVRIHFTGTNCSNCGPQSWAYDIPVPTGYTVQSGDRISWRQYQQGPASPRGGLALAFSDGTYTNWVATDQSGQVMNDLTTQNAWVYRSVDLSQYAGKTIVGGWINEDTGSGAGDWQEWFADIAYYRQDGTVRTIYNRDPSVSYPSFGSSGVTNQTFEINTMQNDEGEPLNTTAYYAGDQIGSTRLSLAAGGWPMSADTYYPFGQNPTASTDSNNYRFATLERDSDTGLDHAMFRQYSSVTGRWMSPDPYNGSYDLGDPQSFNRYSYVGNSPLGFIDPSGLDAGVFTIYITKSICLKLCAWAGPVGWAAAGITALLDLTHILGFWGVHPVFHGSLKPRPNAPNSANCPTVPNHPSNANVNSNINAAQMVNKMSWLNPPTHEVAKLSWFVTQVAPHMAWDYKTQGVQYATFGNFNYGATGAALGIPLEELQMGGGLVAQTVGTHQASWGNFYQPPNYGHDPEDVQSITDGYAYYQQGCYQ